jgi:ribosomal protein S17E
MKEKLDKKLIIVVQRSLYEKFKNRCEKDYKTMSEVLRDFMVIYTKEKDIGKETNK